MSAILIKFDCDNDAFGRVESDQFGLEVADRFEKGYASFPIRDVNGNTIGRAGLVIGE